MKNVNSAPDPARSLRVVVILLLAWNYADTIVPRYRDYLDAGGRFIHPIPLARIIAG